MTLLHLHFQTYLGARTIVVDVPDEATAQAIRAAHEGLGEIAAVVPTMPRLSLSAHIAKHKRSQAKAALRVIEADPKVTPLRKKKP